MLLQGCVLIKYDFDSFAEKLARNAEKPHPGTDWSRNWYREEVLTGAREREAREFRGRVAPDVD